MEIILILVLISLIIGWLCYQLGWFGAVFWLIVCGFVTLYVKTLNLNGNGGCDGGLCILAYLATGLIWLAGCFLAWLIIFVALPKKYRRWWGQPIPPPVP
jgi:hypothetical protein